MVDHFGLGLRLRWTALLAVWGWRFPFDLAEECSLAACDVFDLLAESAESFEIALGGNEGILRFRHPFGDAKQLPFDQPQRNHYAIRHRRWRLVLCKGRANEIR